MTAVEWEDPPPRSWGKYAPLVAELERHPGKWAKVSEGLTFRESENARRTLKSYWGCDVARRKINGSGYSLWARIREEDMA